jgi:hypothetical protein
MAYMDEAQAQAEYARYLQWRQANPYYSTTPKGIDSQYAGPPGGFEPGQAANAMFSYGPGNYGSENAQKRIANSPEPLTMEQFNTPVEPFDWSTGHTPDSQKGMGQWFPQLVTAVTGAIAGGGALTGLGLIGGGAAGAGAAEMGAMTGGAAFADAGLYGAGAAGLAGAAGGASGLAAAAGGSAGAGGAAGLTGLTAGGGGLASLLGGGSTSGLVVQGLTSLAGMGLQTYMSSKALDELAQSSATAGNQLAASNYAAIAEQRRASEAALGYLTQSRDLARADLEPWRQAGIAGLNKVTPMIQAGPGEFTKSPGYDFRLGEGVKALERGAAAKGMQISGRENKALTEYGQNFATLDYDNFLNRYYQSLNPGLALAGLGQTATSNTANLGTSSANTAANLTSNTGTNVANLTSSLGSQMAGLTNTAGQQRASAYSGLGNMYTGSLNQLGTNMSYNNMLSQLAQLYGVS